MPNTYLHITLHICLVFTNCHTALNLGYAVMHTKHFLLDFGLTAWKDKIGMEKVGSYLLLLGLLKHPFQCFSEDLVPISN